MRALPSGLVTFCFADVAGSTRAFRSDPERYPDALRAHHALVRDAFAADDGVIVETEGDGLFAAFGDPARAVNGCLAAQLAIAGHRWPPGLELRSRMGLHCETAVPTGDGYVALGVHQAARVAAAASGGQVLCSAAVAERASGRLQPGATLAALGSFRLKDFDAPAVLFELRHPALAGESPAPRAPRVVPGNMRLSRTSFVGRDEEAAELRTLLAEHRMVTILGPGGVGKTRLAYRLAGELTDSFAQGAWVVELAGVTGAELVTDAVARELPLPGFAGGSPDDAVLAFLASRNLLLVLDNCEHVLAGAAELADRLLDAAPDVRALATSRMPLEVAGEARFQLGPLPLAPPDAALEDLLDADAVRLFVARARSARPHFGLDAANAPVVAAICRRLDGLPLALELAGSRVATLAPGDLLTRLDASLTLLATGARGTPERHRTLEATLAWSYGLLGDAERVLLARLSVFAGRFRLDWAREVCGFGPLAGGQVADLLDGLVAKSLVAAEEVAARTEYGLLLTVREYAAQRLAERGEGEETERRRAAFLVGDLAPRDPIFRFTAETGGYLAAVAAAADEVRASLSWCLAQGDGDQACALIAAVYRWWNVTGRIAELRPLAARAVAIPSGPSLDRVFTYYALILSLEAADAERPAQTRVYADDLLAEARLLGDDNGLALALYCQADFPWAEGDYPAAAALFREAAAAARRAGSDSLAAVISRSEAEVSAAGDSAALADSLGEVVAGFRRAGDPYGLAQTLVVLGATELDCGRAAEAVEHAAEGLRVAREHGYTEVGWRHQTLLAWGATALGDAVTGACLLGAVEAALDRAGGEVGAGQGGPADRDRVRALASRTLGRERFAERYAQGRGLSEAEAATLALAVGQPPELSVAALGPQPDQVIAEHLLHPRVEVHDQP